MSPTNPQDTERDVPPEAIEAEPGLVQMGGVEEWLRQLTADQREAVRTQLSRFEESGVRLAPDLIYLSSHGGFSPTLVSQSWLNSIAPAGVIALSAGDPASKSSLSARVSQEDLRTLAAEAQRHGSTVDEQVREAVHRYASRIRRGESLEDTRKRVEEEARRDGAPVHGRALREYDEVDAESDDDGPIPVAVSDEELEVVHSDAYTEVRQSGPDRA